MKHLSLSRLLLSCVAVLSLVFLSFTSNAQVQTARYNSINGNCGGYYEYLPQGYSSNTWQSYPLIVAVHGIGELGNGTTDLGNLLNCWTAIPRRIANGGFPATVSVGGQSFSFIVISPQFKNWPSGADVNAVVDYAVQHYRVDQSRIYVTGLSMGGGAVWDFAGNFATKAAAVVPVCGAASADPTRAQAIANAKLPIWATHNQDDPTVSVSNTTGWVSMINQYGGNIISTIFQASGHDAWSKTYDPAFTQNGMNVYQWMLSHQKSGSGSTTSGGGTTTTTNQSPTVSAGSNQTITLPTNSASLSGTASDPDGNINFWEWKQASGPSQASISSAYSAKTGVGNLVQGTYTFTLKVTDNGGAISTSNVNVVVNAALATAVSTSGSRIEAENYTSMSGVQKENTSDAGGGQDVGYIDNGDWMDYNVNVSATGTYAVNLRVASPNSGEQLQIKNSSGTVVATVSVPNTGGYQNWQTVTANINLSAGTQTIRIYSTSNGWNFNWWEIAGAGSSSSTSTSGSTTTSGSSSRIEAENYTSMSGVQKENTSDAGGGQNVGYIDYGDWMEYSVSASASGTYAVNLRVASPSGGQLQIKNSAGNVLATVSIPNTGGYQNWQTVSANINLSAGTQTVKIYSTSNGWNFNWWEIAGAGSSTSTNTGSTGTSSSRIEAENYTSMSGVQKENTSDAGGGQNVGYIDYGDWMDYSVSASASGTFAVNLRVASPSGGQLQIKSSAGNVLATVSVPNTGGYQTWQTVTTNINLSAGTQTIRIYSTSNGWNFNWWEIAGAGSSTSTNTGSTGTSSSRIEAENYKTMNGVVKENTADAGGGQDVGYIDYGDWMDYSVNVSASGSYAVNLRIASPTGGQLQIRNSAGTVLATVNIPKTGGWQTWQTVSANINLSSGTQTIRIYSTSNGWNFNWWELSGGGNVSAASAGGVDAGSAQITTTAALGVYPNPITDKFQLEVTNDLTGAMTAQVYDAQGSLKKQFALTKTDAGTSQFYLSIGDLAAATYIIKVNMNNWTESTQIVKQ